MIAALISEGLVSVAASVWRLLKWRQIGPTNQQTTLNPHEAGTKLDTLVKMLSRKSGVTVAKACEALGWQTHTTRATLTGLKKRGYIISRQDRAGKDSIYIIQPENP